MPIFSLPFSIPSEYVVDDDDPTPKTDMLAITRASFVANINEPYRFGPSDEQEYLQQFKRAYFAKTMKRGGWDCLRHYEIMAAGCIPLFINLDKCSPYTLVSLPREIILKTDPSEQYLLDREKYKELRLSMLKWVREKCTAEAVLRNLFIPRVKKDFKRVLLVRGHEGVNYLREMVWIAMIRYLQTVENSVVGELPRITYLYNDYPISSLGNLHGNGYGYARKLDPNQKNSITDTEELTAKTQAGYWDLVVYGKTGPDELEGGGEERLLWQDVKNKYQRDQIVFLYGGDEPFNLQLIDRYTTHLRQNAQYGVCFVRELER